MRTTPLTALLALAIAPLTGCVVNLGQTSPRAPINEYVVLNDGGWVWDKIAVISVSGTIVNGSSEGLFSNSENPVGLLSEKLNRAARDASVKAVILRINSPGGTVTASDAMYREVQRFRERTKKPVVALMMDVAASGGYYVACGSDHIVAYPSTITGSIGVITQTISFRPLMDKIGIEAKAITSGPNKAAGSPLDKLKPEHEKLFQDLVDQFYGQFKTIVRKSRPAIPADKFDMVTDGRVFTGTEAKKLGLVDQVGDLYDAHRRAKELAGLPKAHLMLYRRQGRFAGSMYAAQTGPAPKTGTQINMAQINLDTQWPFGDATRTFLYLWRPGQP